MVPYYGQAPIMATRLFQTFWIKAKQLSMRSGVSGSRETHMTKICNSGKLGEAVVRVSLTTQSTSPRMTLRDAIPSGFGN